MTEEDASSALGEEWVRGEDGRAFRRAARVIVFDPSGRALLTRGHDRDEVERSWWFTIGGGIEAGEDLRQAACRELREETGIVLPPDRLVGPVLHRHAIFDFFAETAHQEEWFFLAFLREGETLERVAPEWTPLEQDVIDEQRWWGAEDLAAEQRRIEVFPVDLPELLATWREGWDGTLVERTDHE